jgi:hypothetical protein
MSEAKEITIVFKVSPEEYERAALFIGDPKYRHYFGRNAFMEKVSRMEANDKNARFQRMKTDADYINQMIGAGLIHMPGDK